MQFYFSLKSKPEISGWDFRLGFVHRQTIAELSRWSCAAQRKPKRFVLRSARLQIAQQSKADSKNQSPDIQAIVFQPEIQASNPQAGIPGLNLDTAWNACGVQAVVTQRKLGVRAQGLQLGFALRSA